MKYLLLKLAEEAGEVVVAAVKHRIHNTGSTRRNLERELGDLYAIAHLLCESRALDVMAIRDQQEERYDRERKRAAAR